MSTLEHQLRNALAKLMDVAPESLSTTQDMSEQGVDSLLGLRFARQVQELTAVEVELEWLYDHPSIAQLAAFLEPRIGRPANT